MNHRQIIGEAWLFTQENKRMIVWYAFIPSFLTTLVGVLYFIYQFYSFKSSVFFENWQESFTIIVLREAYSIARDHTESLVPIIIVLLILAIFYFFLPPIVQGAMIQVIARRKNHQSIRIKDGLRYGLLNFLQLFNYSWVSRSFNLIAIFGEAALLARLIGPEASQLLLPIFILVVIACLIFQILFLFTEYYIVIDDCHIKEAMAKSATLVVKHWDTAFILTFLMLLIAVRILVQIIFVLLVPILLLMFIYFIAASNLPIMGLIIGGILSFGALLFASYLGAIMSVFTSSVWVFTFLYLTDMPDVSAREKLPSAEKIEI